VNGHQPTRDGAPDPPPELTRGLLTRRTALIGLGLGAAGLVAGCDRSSDASATHAGEDRSATEKVVNWSNWPDYIDVGDDPGDWPTLAAFTKKTGIAVHYTEDYNDNESFYNLVKPQLDAHQDTGRDVWCATDWMVARMIRQGYVQKLDKGNIPNAVHLQPSLKSVAFDPGRVYSLPWQSGFTGIGYNPKATGGKKIESVEQLLTDPALKGKVTLLTEMQDTVGLVMIDMGIDPGRFTDAEFDQAISRITQAKASGQIRAFTGNDYTDDLASGRTAACFAYTGDIVQLQVDNPQLGYALPPKGHVIWSDNFIIPKLSRHKANAERLINYYYSADVMASVEDWVNYISPVVGSQQVLLKSDPDIAKNVLIFPTPDVLARAHTFRGLTAAEEQRYTDAFQQLVSG
jgi:spermidine/putrescine transport system substrate-binding protein